MKDNLEDLVKIIRSKKNEDPTKSYTSSLMKGGIEVCIDKLEEEFDELKEALNKNSNIVHETADTVYHMLVALEVANVKFEDVLIELKKRKKQSGFKEKKNRT